jgi:hypothetical protein
MISEIRRQSVGRAPACVIVVGMLIFGSVGCKNSDELETSPVSGRVTLDGAPVSTGTVTFVPSRGRAAKGEIKQDGRFVLSTYRPEDGAIVGKHKAAVMVLRSDIQKTPGPEQEQSIMAIPPRYAIAEESGLEYEVKTGQTNEFTLELSSK